jgi:hypothetical protein
VIATGTVHAAISDPATCLLAHFIHATACILIATTRDRIQILHGYKKHLSTANSGLSTIHRHKKWLRKISFSVLPETRLCQTFRRDCEPEQALPQSFSFSMAICRVRP